MASTESRKFSVRHLLTRSGLYLVIAVPGLVCLVFLLRERPGPNGYAGIQVLPLVLMITYINALELYLSQLLTPVPRDRKLNQVLT